MVFRIGALRGLAALGASVGVAAALSACGGSGTSKVSFAQSPSHAGESARTGVPTKAMSNVAWYTFYRPVLSLVAATTNDYPEEMVDANLCESVVRLAPNYTLKPGLTTFSQNSAATVFTYTIRPGAKFWDGSLVTPADVLFSLKTNMTPPVGAANGGIWNEIKSMKQTGPKTIEIALRAPDIRFNYKIASNAGMVYEKRQALAAGQNWGTPAGKVMCTGPYQLGAWNPASSIEIVRNPRYWSTDFKPLVKSITFSWNQDPTTDYNAFTAGKLGGGWNIPPSIVAPLERSGAGQMYVGRPDTGLQVYTLVAANLKRGPIANPLIRRALSLAIDRQALASKIFDGAATPQYTLAPPGSFAYETSAFKQAAEKAATSQSIAEAKKLIAQTGKPAPTLTLAYPAGDSLATPTAVAVQTDAKAAGIPIKLDPMPAAQYASVFTELPSKPVNLIFSIYAPPVELDPLPYYQEAMLPTGVDNFNAYSNPTVTSLLDKAAVTTNTSVRAQDTLKVQEVFNEEMPWIPLESLPVTAWQGKGITGVPTTFTYLESPWAALLGGK